MNDLYVLAHYSNIVTGEIIIAVILAIILLSLILERHKRKSTVYFALTCAITIISISADMVYWLYMYGKDIPAIVTGICTAVSYSAAIMLLPLSLYQKTFVLERTNIKPLVFNFLIYLSVLYLAIMIFAIISGRIFVVENGIYRFVGEIPAPAKFLVAFMYLYLLIVLFFIREKIGTRAYLLLSSFGFIPVLFIVFLYDYTPIGTGINLILVYVFLQNNISEEKERYGKELEVLNGELIDRQNKLKEYALHDMVSGCKNRNALDWVYDISLDRSNSVAVVMCDMNDLKKINDILGHDAGDSMIREFAAKLMKIFGNDNVYRIGGDEFVVVLNGCAEDEVSELVSKSRDIIGKKASIGYIFKNRFDENFDELLKKADADMYEQKEIYYSSNTKYR